MSEEQSSPSSSSQESTETPTSSDTTEEELEKVWQLDTVIYDDVFRAEAEADNMDGYWFYLKEVLQYGDLEEDLHGDICDILTQGGHKFLFLLPRGHLKSSNVTIGWTMWRICQNANRTIGIFNETEDLPRAFLREIREHFEQNPIVKKHWGHLVPDRQDGNRVWRSDAIQLKRDIILRTPTVEAKSVNESTAGRHPDAMILDDPISNATCKSETAIEASITRFKELQALLEPPDAVKDPIKGTLIVIGTRWHWQDLYNYIIENLHEYYLIMKRAAVEDGKVIFPQKFNEDILREKLKAMGEWVYSAQYMNEPVNSENAHFPPKMLRKARWSGSRSQFLATQFCNIFTAIDPAWEGDDCWAIVTMCVDQAGRYRVLEALRSYAKPTEAMETCVGAILRWKPTRVGFEAIGGQEWLRKNLQADLRKLKVNVPLIPLSHNNTQKELRILGLAPEIQHQRLIIHESCSELFAELVQFPRSKYRDLMDATEMCFRIAQLPGLHSRRRNAREVQGTGEYELAQLETDGETRGGIVVPARRRVI